MIDLEPIRTILRLTHFDGGERRASGHSRLSLDTRGALQLLPPLPLSANPVFVLLVRATDSLEHASRLPTLGPLAFVENLPLYRPD